MWYKVAWLFLWMTLAFWAGCAGENQNYEINKQNIDTFEPPPDGGPAAPAGSATQAEPMFELAVCAAAEEIEQAGDEVPAATPEGNRSLTGLSRQTWPTLVVGADEGRVVHHPRYFGASWAQDVWGTWRATPDRSSPLLATGDIEREAALATGRCRMTWSTDDAADVGLAYSKFAVDMITLPGAVVVTPPWALRHSPAE